MGDGTAKIVEGQLRVDLDRAREVGHPRVVVLPEPPAPEPHDPSSVVPASW